LWTLDLTGKVAVVTGGSSGIGLAAAHELARAGASVVVAARNREKIDGAVEAIVAAGGKAIGISCDAKIPEQCSALIADTVQQLGRVDILVNNSGTNFRKQPQDYSLQDWHDVIDTNLTSAFLLSQAVYPHFLAAGQGKIINIASLLARMGGAAAVAYGPSKGGIVQLTRALTAAWAKNNIQANAILPGWTDTPLTEDARSAFPALEKTVTDRTPAGRWGQPIDIAQVVVFLASSAADFINGAEIVVDGGYSIQS